MRGLVLGFGAFRDVDDNPSARIARALDGRSSGNLTLVGAEMTVSYARSIDETRKWVEEVAPAWVVGIGVSAQRQSPAFERYGTAECSVHPDVDGVVRVPSAGLHEAVYAPCFARHLGCEVSTHAGSYVCNAWLHQVGRLYPLLPVNFLHVPRAGVDPDVLFAALVGASAEVDLD